MNRSVLLKRLPATTFPPAALLAAVVLLTDGRVLSQRQDPADGFTFFHPTAIVTREDRERLDRGEVVVRTLSGSGGQLAVFTASALDAPADVLATRVHAIEDLKRSEFVLGIRRFSDPPVLDDLTDLTLDDDDLQAIRRCRPGDCDVKLSAGEMATLQQAADEAGLAWRDTLQDVFRRIVLERVVKYQGSGLEGLASYADRGDSVSMVTSFAAILERSPFLWERLPEFARYLEGFPQVTLPAVESFLYWSKERFGGKPTVSVTHVSILRPEERPDLPAVVVAGKQIFATHYMNGALALTVGLRGTAGASNHLAYLNRLEVDVLGGFFGPLKRAIAHRRIRRETATVFRALRVRLESEVNGSAGSSSPSDLPGRPAAKVRSRGAHHETRADRTDRRATPRPGAAGP